MAVSCGRRGDRGKAGAWHCHVGDQAALLCLSPEEKPLLCLPPSVGTRAARPTVFLPPLQTGRESPERFGLGQACQGTLPSSPQSKNQFPKTQQIMPIQFIRPWGRGQAGERDVCSQRRPISHQAPRPLASITERAFSPFLPHLG